MGKIKSNCSGSHQDTNNRPARHRLRFRRCQAGRSRSLAGQAGVAVEYEFSSLIENEVRNARITLDEF